MKKLSLFVVLAAPLLLGGCKALVGTGVIAAVAADSIYNVTQNRDKGGPSEIMETFNKPYDAVWRAATQALVSRDISNTQGRAGSSYFYLSVADKDSGIIQTQWADTYDFYASCNVFDKSQIRVRAEMYLNKKGSATTTLRLKTNYEAFSNETNTWYKCQSERRLEYSLLADIKNNL